jgi:hypothetical protein
MPLFSISSHERARQLGPLLPSGMEPRIPWMPQGTASTRAIPPGRDKDPTNNPKPINKGPGPRKRGSRSHTFCIPIL